LISWGSTPVNNRVHGLVSLLARPDWRTSAQGVQLRDKARDLLDDPDDTVRMLAAPALVYLIINPAELRDELERRLATETHAGIRAQLIRTLDAALCSHPDYIDTVLARLSEDSAWPILSSAPEPTTEAEQAGPDIDDHIIQILIALAVIHEQQFATTILQTWLSAPATHGKRASRTCAFLRDYLNHQPGRPEGTTDRAFALLAAPLSEARAIWTQAAEAAQPAANSEQQARVRAVVKVCDTIASDLYFASGATPASQEGATPPTEDFTARAFPVLEELTHISYPAVVHRVVETLEHLADQDHRRAFLAIAAAATTPHGYQWEHQGAELVMRIIDRYAADNRDLLLSEPACLSALRQLLEAFVRSGWDQAIQRVQDLSEFLY
jgi:hypothetical protein